MRIGQGEVWLEYFEQALANCTGLDEATVEEMKGDIALEYSLLELDEVEEPSRLPKLMAMTDRLLASYQKSMATTESVIEDVKRVALGRSVATSFPVSNIDELPKIDAPLKCLEELMAELRRHGDYNRVREEYCQLSTLLNLQGLVAPAFRPATVTGMKFGDSVFKAIHRDKLVIDCHWMSVTKQFVKVRAKDIEFAPMFKGNKPFPFDLAWQFANRVWTANHRVVDMLRLTEFQQCQLAALRSDVIKKRIEGIENGTRKGGVFIPAPLSIFEQGLNAWCERDRRICKHREGYVAVWKARSFLGEAASVRQVGELAAMMLGEAPKDDKTIRGREEKIGRHILGV